MEILSVSGRLDPHVRLQSVLHLDAMEEGRLTNRRLRNDLLRVFPHAVMRAERVPQFDIPVTAARSCECQPDAAAAVTALDSG